MKKLLLTFLTLLCFSVFVKGQDKNEQLYQAIIKKDKEQVNLLLKDSANSNYVKSVGPWMKTNMLISAINKGDIDIAKLLIANKADVNWKDGFQTTALMYAASMGDKEMVDLLLDNGADITTKDGQGNTVITAAKESKNKQLIKYLETKLKDKK